MPSGCEAVGEASDICVYCGTASHDLIEPAASACVGMLSSEPSVVSDVKG